MHTAGEVFNGRYRLLRQLSIPGADRLVWEAEDLFLGRRASVHLLPEGVAHDPAARERFKAQGRLAASGQAGDGPRVYDAGSLPETDEPYLVTELAAAASDGEPTTAIPMIAAPVEPPRDVLPPAAPGLSAPRAAPRPLAPAPRSRTGPAFLVPLLATLFLVGVGAVFAAQVLRPPNQAVTAPTAAGAATAVPAAAATPAPKVQPATPPPARPTATPLPPRPTPTRPLAIVVPTSPPPTAPVPTSAPAVAPPAAPTSAPTPPPAPAPPPRTAAPTPDPAATILQHYELIDSRRYDQGYELMSSRLRAANSPAVYRSWFQNKIGLQPLSVEVVSRDTTTAVIRALVRSSDRVNGQEVTQDVAEQFVLRLEDGAWRIDQVTRLT